MVKGDKIFPHFLTCLEPASTREPTRDHTQTTLRVIYAQLVIFCHTRGTLCLNMLSGVQAVKESECVADRIINPTSRASANVVTFILGGPIFHVGVKGEEGVSHDS